MWIYIIYDFAYTFILASAKQRRQLPARSLNVTRSSSLTDSFCTALNRVDICCGPHRIRMRPGSDPGRPAGDRQEVRRIDSFTSTVRLTVVSSLVVVAVASDVWDARSALPADYTRTIAWRTTAPRRSAGHVWRTKTPRQRAGHAWRPKTLWQRLLFVLFLIQMIFLMCINMNNVLKYVYWVIIECKYNTNQIHEFKYLYITLICENGVQDLFI